MTVKSVKNDGSSRLGTVVASTAAGTAAGYAMKWAWPLQKSENTLSKKAMVNYCRKITNKAAVQEFKNAGITTKAQDCFVKMIESGDKKAFNPKSIVKKVEALGGESSVAGKEFRAIIRNVDEQAKELVRRFAVAHNIMLRKIRPSIPFLVAGAGIGFFTGFTHNVMKSDYYA